MNLSTVEDNNSAQSTENAQRVVANGIARPNVKDTDKYFPFQWIITTIITFSTWNRPVLKRQADEIVSTESDSKRLRLDDISGETIAHILEVVNDPKKMLGPEVLTTQSLIQLEKKNHSIVILERVSWKRAQRWSSQARRKKRFNLIPRCWQLSDAESVEADHVLAGRTSEYFFPSTAAYAQRIHHPFGFRLVRSFNIVSLLQL